MIKNSPPRERCRYGSRCYRKNLKHLHQFCHPADRDWDAKPNPHENKRGGHSSLRSIKAVSYKESDGDESEPEQIPQAKKRKVPSTVSQDTKDLGWGIHATKTSKPNADHTYVPQLESTDKDEEDDGDDDEDEEDTDERPICRFGAGCFRKNPKHFEEFRHPEINQQLAGTKLKAARIKWQKVKTKLSCVKIFQQEHKNTKGGFQKAGSTKQKQIGKKAKESGMLNKNVEGCGSVSLGEDHVLSFEQQEANLSWDNFETEHDSNLESWTVAPLSPNIAVLRQPTEQQKHRVLPSFISSKAKQSSVATTIERAPSVVTEPSCEETEEAPQAIYETPRVCDSSPLPLLQSNQSGAIISRSSSLLAIPCFFRGHIFITVRHDIGECQLYEGVECYLHDVPAETAKTISRFCKIYDGDLSSKVTQATTHIISSVWNFEDGSSSAFRTNSLSMRNLSLLNLSFGMSVGLLSKGSRFNWIFNRWDLFFLIDEGFLGVNAGEKVMQLRKLKQLEIELHRRKLCALACVLRPRRVISLEAMRFCPIAHAGDAHAQHRKLSWKFLCFPRTYRTLSKSFSTFETNRILGIESSCDETAVSIVSSDGRVISSVIASQWAQQIEHSGVYPLVAARCHEKCIQAVFDQAVETARNEGFHLRDVDAIAVTAGPGLGPCLSIGLQFAKTISQSLSKPLVAVNHIEAHAMVARLTRPEIEFPFLALIVSGGHTELWLAKAVGDYVIIGDTLDDAMGEAFDKVARMLHIPQSLDKEEAGGAAVERLAREGTRSKFSFPIPMESSSSCDFSFSGLKSSVRRLLQLQSKENNTPEGIFSQQLAADVCFSFQETAICHIEKRIVKAFAYLASGRGEPTLLSPRKALNEVPVKHLVVGGGVAGNSVLRNRLLKLGNLFGVETVFPPPEHCSDNAIMIAWTGCEKYRLGIRDSSEIVYQPRWPVGPKVEFSLDLKKSNWKAFNARYKSHRRMLRYEKK